MLLCYIINSNAAQQTVFHFTINQEIGPSMTRLTEAALTQADKEKANFILLTLDTYGGTVDDGDKIRTLLLKSKIPTLVYVKNNAASAGALIAIACDSIYMASGATIGAACVVNQQGELMPEKYQSYMRKKMRATAEETGRNPLVAEGMADEHLIIDSLKEDGKIVSLTTEEAIKMGYCNAKVNDEKDILHRLSNDTRLVEQQNSFADTLVLFFLSPSVSGILLLLIFGGLFMEFKAPGTLIPIAIAGVAAVFYFLPLYMDGLAANWEIALFVLGLLLLLLEIFVIPGFGLTGILGILFIISGLSLAMVRNLIFDFTFVAKGSFANSLLIVSLALAFPLALVLFFGKRFFDSRAFRKMSVKSEMTSNEGFSVKESKLDLQIGKTALATTDLRPQGKVEIEDETYEANAEGAFIPMGSNVHVVGTRANYLIVKKIH